MALATASVVPAMISALPVLAIAPAAGQLDPGFGNGKVTMAYGLGDSLGAFEPSNGVILGVSKFSEPAAA